MTLAKLAQTRKNIEDQPMPLREDNIKAFEYIQYVASRTNTDIKKWDLFERFGTEGEEKTLLKDKKAINKIFFDIIEKDQENKKKSILNEIPQLLSALQTQLEARKEERIRVLKRSVISNTQRANDYYRRFEIELENIISSQVELESLESGDPISHIRDELDDVLSQGYWINPVFEDGYLYLNTATDVVNVLKDKKRNLDIIVNLGQFSVKINLRSFQLRVIPYKNNLRSSNHFHPFVSSDGKICWGSSREQVTKWIGELKIGSVLQLLYALLHKYSEHNRPWRPLQYFKTDVKKYGRIAEELKHPYRKKKKTPKLDKMAENNAPAQEIPANTNNTVDYTVPC